MPSPLWLVGDIGGTNARFALFPAGADATTQPLAQERLAAAEHPGLAEAVETFLVGADCGRPEAIALAVAAPILGDQIDFTNSPWSFSTANLRQRLAVERLEVVNDFAALALALPDFGSSDLSPIPDSPPAPTPQPSRPLVVLGPGTGLGIASAIPCGDGTGEDGWLAVPGEGGHVSMAPGNSRESILLDRVRDHFGHVSAERVLSGPGLVNLARAVAEAGHEEPRPYPQTPEAVTQAALAASPDPISREALRCFCAFLGSVAGNAALTLGAHGGVYLAGGILPRLGKGFDSVLFRERFEAKGRFKAYLAGIPTYLLIRDNPAFVGLLARLRGRKTL